MEEPGWCLNMCPSLLCSKPSHAIGLAASEGSSPLSALYICTFFALRRIHVSLMALHHLLSCIIIIWVCVLTSLAQNLVCIRGNQ